MSWPSYFKVISDIFTITVLISISIYHALVYIGRRKYNIEKYNLYFAFFVFSAALLIFFNNSLSQIIFNWHIYILIEPTGMTISSLSMLVFSIKFLRVIIKVPASANKIFILCYSIMVCSILLSLPIFFFGWRWYWENLSVIIFLVSCFGELIPIAIFIYWFIRNKVYKDRVNTIILLSTFLIGAYFIFNAIQNLIDINNFYTNNFIFVGIVVFVFAYVLSKKFNKEFEELVDLKNNLEKKIKLRTQELETAKQLIERESQRKSTFFINIAHEVKTPLTLIDNYLDKEINKRGTSEALAVVKNNVIKLKNDIINLLDIEKINRGNIIYKHNNVVDFSFILKNRSLLFSEAAQKKDIIINTEIQKNVFIKIDPYALDRIINNLIDNALKYTNNGGNIFIGLSIVNNVINFTVEDNGVGIPKKDLKHIFKPFYQISSKKKNIQGVGLGLAIVKSIVDEVCGELSVMSEVSKGTKFVVTFKNHKPRSEAEIVKDIPYVTPISVIQDIKEIEYSKNKNTILIVEDNMQMLSYLHELLKDAYNVFYALNGKQALNKLNWIPEPDIIISDIMMDVMDGYEFYDEVSRNEQLQKIPFIFLTAKSQSKEKLKALSKGAVDFISKPFNSEMLMAKIESLLHNIVLQRESHVKDFKQKISSMLDKNKKKVDLYSLLKKYNISRKEIAVIELISKGLEYKEMTDLLGLSLSGIKKRVHSIYKKFKVDNKVELLNFIKKYK